LLGGWAQRIEILPGVKVLPLPDGIEPLDFMGGGCGLPTGFHAVERAGIALGDTVVIQGSGPVGLNAAIFAQLAGALRVFVLGAPKARLEAAKRLGAEDVLDLGEVPNSADRVAWVRGRTAGRGADVVIEASGNPAAVPEGLEMLRDAGRYVVVGQYTDAGDTTLNPHRHINRRHATILGCWGYEFTHLHRALQMMASHNARFRWRELITREYRLKDAGQALEDMERLAVVKSRPPAVASRVVSWRTKSNLSSPRFSRCHPERSEGSALVRSSDAMQLGAGSGRSKGSAVVTLDILRADPSSRRLPRLRMELSCIQEGRFLAALGMT